MSERENDKRITAGELAGKVARMCRAVLGNFAARVAADLLRPEMTLYVERTPPNPPGPDMPPRRPEDYPYTGEAVKA